MHAWLAHGGLRLTSYRLPFRVQGLTRAWSFRSWHWALFVWL